MQLRHVTNAIKAVVLHSYFFVLLVVLGFALMVALSSYFMTRIVRNQLEYNAQAALDSLENSIKTDLKEPRTLLGSQSDCILNMILRGASQEEVHTYLNDIAQYILYSDETQLSGFGGIFGFFDVFGGVLLDGQNRAPPEDYDPRSRPWYQDAVAAGGQIVFLHPHTGVMARTPSVVIAYSRALFDDEGNLLGVVALNMDLERIRGYIIDANFDKLWFGILLNQQYEFICHRERSLEGTRFADVNSDTARVTDELKKGHTIAEFRMVNYQNIPSITFFRKLENGWYLGIVTPEDEYFSEVRRVRLFLIFLGAVLSIVFSAIIIRIVAEKQKADAKIKEADKAIMANHVKSDFLAKMSHEIRSPMNVILGLTEMQLEREGLPPDTTEALEKMHNSGYLLLNIINDILDLSKIESGKMELTPVNYDVASVINDTVQLNIMRFENKPIKFSMEVEENIPLTLHGDGLRIKQILNNILSNAFKYTDTGEVVLSVSAEESGEGNPVTLVFSVRDTGHGMTQDQVARLFEDYTRFNAEAHRQIEGTGLGMSITKHFVEMMQGDISVKSEQGKGSVFTVRLPQGYVDSAVLGKTGVKYLQQLYIDRRAKEKQIPQISRDFMPYGKVLVVDDMEPNLYVANMLLSPYGLVIDTATSGQKAIDKIKNGMVYDIIFMDHYMPGMDGLEATKIIRDLGYTHPIVALTANAIVGQAKMFLENGFDGFISKPIDTRQLDSTLNKLIRDQYPEETVEAARHIRDQMAEEASHELPDLSLLRALIVDDFLPNSDLTAGLLEEYRMQVDYVLSGPEAIELIKNGEPRYDIIFMDILMPDMDGMETTRLIRSMGTEYANTVPIVALSAIVESEAADKEKALLENGFQAVLYKPLTIESVDVFIRDWMNDKIANCTIPPEKKERTMEVNIPGVDKERVTKIYGEKTKIFVSVLRSYLSVVPDHLEKMSHVSAETLSQYVTSVHGVKSVSDSIGAEEARKMALELELMAKAGNLSGVMAKNGVLINYVKDLLVNIQNWLAKADAQ